MQQTPVLTLDLDGRAGSVSRARKAVEHHFDHLVATAGLRLTAETRLDVTLVVAELVGNACRHAPGPCRLTVTARPRAVRIAVEDTSTRLPVPVRPTGPGGYGLLVVTRLSRTVQIFPVPGGKVVEATVPAR